MIPEVFARYLKNTVVNTDIKSKIKDEFILSELSYIILDIVCNKNCPLRQEDENGVCTRSDCVEYVDAFLKQMTLVLIPRGDHSDR